MLPDDDDEHGEASNDAVVKRFRSARTPPYGFDRVDAPAAVRRPQPAPAGVERLYRVTIGYEEQTHDAESGLREGLFHGSFEVRATSEEEAVQAATAEFKATAAASWVAWPRIIKSVRCVVLG